ncbi:hypothetical protein AB0M43_27080 [Longispora sp. NPDC051575]|uniref:hypothetical protein n=1 Tax=Longispora sp. NPDC051575 TaxID=3154943 RepID=UPI0034220A8A
MITTAVSHTIAILLERLAPARPDRHGHQTTNRSRDVGPHLIHNRQITGTSRALSD